MKLFGNIKQALKQEANKDEGRNKWSIELLDKMRLDWDERARENARHYVATLQEEWTDEEFFRSGEIWVQEYIGSQLETVCQGRQPTDMQVLEIGCGAGRVTRALSRLFSRVVAVDVSGEMIARARQALSECPNVQLHQNNGVDLAMFDAEEFDFAFSSIVFQHIPSKAVIENYIHEAWRVLRPQSLFTFQAQGVPIDEKTCDTWVGVGFTDEEMEDIAARSRFVILNSVGAGTQYYWLNFLKT